MQTIANFIESTHMIKRGEVIGVGVSGGSDSMALLHYLATEQSALDIEIVAVHVDHGIRVNSYMDADFVREKAKELGVRFYKFRIDAPKLAKDKHIGLEAAAREARYGVFSTLLRKGVVDKIALAHHMQDQAETILMHLFRGAGIAGAKGMEPIRDQVYIRPMLTTSKAEILAYNQENGIDCVEDETNTDTTYARNFLRNVVFPTVTQRWPNAIAAICQFGQSVNDDDAYIRSQIYADAMLFEGKLVRVPTSYFLYPSAIVSRILFNAFHGIGILQDIERKHISAITELALHGNNGSRVYLPFEAIASKEYDYVTISNRQQEQISLSQPFKVGEFSVPGFGSVCVRRVKTGEQKDGALYIDYRKVPKNAVWRLREDGDMFTKFGGGTKKLKSYLIDKKVPLRVRNMLPVLACENEIYVIAGVEISDYVRAADVPTVYEITVKK